MPIDLVRDAAIDVLLRVFEDRSFLDASLDKTLRRKSLSERGRRFMTQLAYGTVRHKLLCDHILTPLLRQPLDDLPKPILTILRMGVYQALYLSQVTFPAMVHTSVDLAKKRGHVGTAKLVNAVLKRVPQSLDEVSFPSREDGLARHLSVRHSMPQWIVELWMEEFGPEETETLCEACDREAPTTLRVNTLKSTVEQLTEGLGKSEYIVQKRTEVPEELTLLEGPPPVKAKLFQAGHFIVQDAASMLPPHLLEPRPGSRVLDMSAAPGGKSTHIAALAGDRAWVAAMDRQERKLERVVENAERLGTTGVVPLCGDGRRPPFAGGFDRVLVDAPCSGLGTLRRHPDLKWRLKPADFRELADIQLELLRSAVSLCENDGLIVYSVCTFSRPETEGVAEAILAEGRVRPDEGPDWMAQWKIGSGRYRILPRIDGMDGFFLMRLRKVS